MDNFYLFLGVGAILIYLILEVDKQQRKRLKNVLKHSTKVEPLFLIQSAGNKLNKLQSALAGIENSANSNMPYKNITKQLKETVAAYNAGKLPVDTYHSKLEDLINTVKKHNNDIAV
jgi:hypothetical protein